MSSYQAASSPLAACSGTGSRDDIGEGGATGKLIIEVGCVAVSNPRCGARSSGSQRLRCVLQETAEPNVKKRRSLGQGTVRGLQISH